MARSAGSSVQLMAKEGKYATLRLPSGEMRMVLAKCRATIGLVGNIDQENINIGKAGRSRWLGIRPANRGVVMNPVDHPHGGVRAALRWAAIRSRLGANLHWVRKLEIAKGLEPHDHQAPQQQVSEGRISLKWVDQSRKAPMLKKDF